MRVKGGNSIVGVGPLAMSLLLLALNPAFAASPVRFSGELTGLVTDSGGHPQIGAAVFLFNRQDRLLLKSATDSTGNFTFAELLPDLYSVQVTLSSFIPAMKDRIQIRPGMRSLLEVNLSKVLSTVQLVSVVPAPGGLMSDSWKWTVRTDSLTRPILRILPAQIPPVQQADEVHGTVHASHFRDSRGLIRFSASDGVQASAGATDLATQFAFATSLNGINHFQVAGDVGFTAASGSPSAAFRTTWSRDLFNGGARPSIGITMRQIVLPFRLGQTLTTSADAPLPTLRTLSVGIGDNTSLGDSLELEYGVEMNSVSFLDRLHYFSPYAKLTYTLPHGYADLTWTSGNERPQLGRTPVEKQDLGSGGDLQRDLAVLAVLPQVSVRAGRARIQRGDNYEMGLTEVFGTREYRVAGYHERVSNTALTIASPEPGSFSGDLLPDVYSSSAIFNQGKFETWGYTSSVSQNLGDRFKVAVVYGSVGVLAPRSLSLSGNTADDLRRDLRDTHRQAVTLRASGNLRGSGTRFVASYEWTDYHAAVPTPTFSTQPTRLEPGLNVIVHQPIPAFPGMPWRMEASAEFRNLLAQGYLPLMAPGGEQILLVNTPRSFRGGLAFVF